jgi:hypothetical protein
MKPRTQSRYYAPRNEIPYPEKKHVPRAEIVYPEMKSYTQKGNDIPRNETPYPEQILCTQK